MLTHRCNIKSFSESTMNRNGQKVACLPSAWKPRHRDDLRRLGSKHDGGYVVTDDIVGNTDIIVGLGIGTNWDFERDFQKFTRCPVHSYDHTVSSNLFLRSALPNFRSITRLHKKETIRNILFSLRFKYFFSGKNRHFKEKVTNDPSVGADFSTIFSRISESDRVFVKMDIEGWEYSVLNDIKPYYERVSGLAVEFHHLDTLGHVADMHINDIKKFFDIVHVHVNNCGALNKKGKPGVLEMTFENKRLRGIEGKDSGHKYPIDGLDSPNSEDRPDYRLIFTD